MAHPQSSYLSLVSLLKHTTAHGGGVKKKTESRCRCRASTTHDRPSILQQAACNRQSRFTRNLHTMSLSFDLFSYWSTKYTGGGGSLMKETFSIELKVVHSLQSVESDRQSELFSCLIERKKERRHVITFFEMVKRVANQKDRTVDSFSLKC